MSGFAIAGLVIFCLFFWCVNFGIYTGIKEEFYSIGGFQVWKNKVFFKIIMILGLFIPGLMVFIGIFSWIYVEFFVEDH